MRVDYNKEATMRLICECCGNKNIFHASQICEQIIHIGGDGKCIKLLSVPEIFKTKDVICPMCENEIKLTEQEELEIGR